MVILAVFQLNFQCFPFSFNTGLEQSQQWHPKLPWLKILSHLILNFVDLNSSSQEAAKEIVGGLRKKEVITREAANEDIRLLESPSSQNVKGQGTKEQSN